MTSFWRYCLMLLVAPSLVVSIDPIVFHHGNAQEMFLRELQTSGGNLPDLVGDNDDCAAVGGLRMLCDIYQRVGPEEDFMDMNVTVECDLGEDAFDLRRATGCECWVTLTPKDPTRITKDCPCQVCPIGFGSSSVSIDCNDYILVALPRENVTESEMPSMSPTESANSEQQRELIADGYGMRHLQDQSISPSMTLVNMSDGTMTPTVGEYVNSTTTMAPSVGLNDSDNETGSMVPTMALGNGDNATGTSLVPSLAPAVSTDSIWSNYSDHEYDPYIFDTCVSVDCGANCNGTCSLGCDVAGQVCSFCSDTPTDSPTGLFAGDGIPTFAPASSGGATTIFFWATRSSSFASIVTVTLLSALAL